MQFNNLIQDLDESLKRIL